MVTTAPRVFVVWKPEAGFGLGTIVHLVPSQCSIRVLNAPPVLKEPTAQTSLAEVAATALSVADPPVLGLGLTIQPVQARWPAAAGGAVARAESSKVAAAVTPVAVRAIHGMSARSPGSGLPVLLRCKTMLGLYCPIWLRRSQQAGCGCGTQSVPDLGDCNTPPNGINAAGFPHVGWPDGFRCERGNGRGRAAPREAVSRGHSRRSPPVGGNSRGAPGGDPPTRPRNPAGSRACAVPPVAG